jgi:hypothetical protein
VEGKRGQPIMFYTLGSAHVLAVRPWHTGCLFVSSHAVSLSRLVVLV